MISESSSLLDVGCIVCSGLKKAGISAFLSGGAVVSIYSENEFQSYDLDFISFGDFKSITRVMIALGFSRESGRHFVHPKSDFFVEFPGNAATVGDEPISEFSEIRTQLGILKLLTPTHCVMDRLSAFYHWNDQQSLEQALGVAKAKRVNLKQIRAWSGREGMAEKFKIFEKRLRKLRTAQP